MTLGIGGSKRRLIGLAAAVALSAPTGRQSFASVATSVPPPPRAVFALIIGVNASPGPDVTPLQYADDDAARYLDLFRALGARAAYTLKPLPRRCSHGGTSCARRSSL
jgi:hypothetical protein